MADATDVPDLPDDESVIAWALANPDAIRNALRALKLLRRAEFRLVKPAASNRAVEAFIESETNFILRVPLQLKGPIADATSSSDVVAKFNTLLAYLRETTELPS